MLDRVVRSRNPPKIDALLSVEPATVFRDIARYFIDPMLETQLLFDRHLPKIVALPEPTADAIERIELRRSGKVVPSVTTSFPQ